MARSNSSSICPPPAAEDNLALLPGVSITVSASHPTGGAARDPSVLLNDTAHQLDGHPFADFDKRHTFDTYDGQNKACGPDWYALSFPEPVTANCVEMTMGFAYRNGGWWTTLSVEVRSAEGEAWQPVQRLNVTPCYSFGDSRGRRRPFQTHELTFEPVCAREMRIIGLPGGFDQFTSLARLAVYHRDHSRRRPAAYLTSAPVPELFHLISPQVVWDLSASVRKLTRLSVSLPLMEFYLDQERYEHSWQAQRRSYEGEPELWFLLGEALGWDAFNVMDDHGTACGNQEPYVRRTFHGSLAHAVAPIVVGGRVLGEMISDLAVVRDGFDWHWHHAFAARTGIPWPTYRAAVRRSPQLTGEQLDGLATLMGLSANPIANLVYRLDGAHVDLEGRAEQQKRIVSCAIEFMQLHLEEPIGVPEVAHAVSLSPHYLAELFAAQTGQAPSDFLIALRVERAKEYLAFTGMSPSDVCMALGYSPSYFWRLFKRRTGNTPAHFARKMRTRPGR